MKKIFCFTLLLSVFSFINAQDSESSTDSLSGFDGIKWGTSYNDAKDRFRTLSSSADTSDPVNIVADKPGQEIIVKRKNVTYRYVFYTKPAILVSPGKSANETPAPESEQGTNPPAVNPETIPRLYFVESTFPYVPGPELESKLSEKYGKRTGGNLNEKTNRGYFLWMFSRGYIIQWIDPYKKKPYTRSLYYTSKDIIEEIKNDFPKYEYSSEIKTMMDILY